MICSFGASAGVWKSVSWISTTLPTLLPSGCTAADQPERIGRMITIVRDRPSIVGVRDYERIRLSYLLACEFFGVSVTCFHNYFIASCSGGIVEPVGAMRDPVIDPSHEPPERDTGIDITGRIGVGGAVMQCPVLEFSLRDHIANLTIQFQLPVTGRILVRQTFEADLYDSADPLLPACGCGPD